MSSTESTWLTQSDNDDVVIPELPQHIQAQIHGEISGQVAVGSNIVQLGSVHGGVVNIHSAEVPPVKLRALPVLLRPRPFTNLIGRDHEVQTALDILKTFTPTEICGPEGIGKTSLLRYLAHRPEFALLFPDGLVYLSARSKPAADLLQAIYDAFYDYNPTIKPTEAQITHALQDKRALIVLDDVRLSRDDLEGLMDVISGATFLFSAPEQLLWSEGECIELQGLTANTAIALIENTLGRSLSAEEKAAAKQLCNLLKGHPLRLLQSLSQVKQKLRSLEEIVRQHRFSFADKTQYTDAERQVISVLSTVGSTGLQVTQVVAVIGLANAEEILQNLHQQGVVQMEGDRYRIHEADATQLEQTWNIRPYLQQALTYFIQFADQHAAAPETLLQEADLFLTLLNKAAEVGLWAEVLTLGQFVEKAFAIQKQWGAWNHVLQLGLLAARNTGQRAAEALMLHQIGTRAVCLGEHALAKQTLSQAIEIRDSLGDRTGATISRHNLRILIFILATATTTAAAAIIYAKSASASVGAGTIATATVAGTAPTAAGTATTATLAGTTGSAAVTSAGTGSGIGLAQWLLGGAGIAIATTGAVVGANVINQQLPQNQTTKIETVQPIVEASPAPGPIRALTQAKTDTTPWLQFNTVEIAPGAESVSSDTPALDGNNAAATLLGDQRNRAKLASKRQRGMPLETVTSQPAPTQPPIAVHSMDEESIIVFSSATASSSQVSSIELTRELGPQTHVLEPPVSGFNPATTTRTVNETSTSQLPGRLGTTFETIHEVRNYYRQQRGE